MSALRVILVDDQELFRSALRVVCQASEDITVVGEAGNGKSGLATARELRPDVVLMDLRMPIMDGIEATAKIVEALPKTAVIALTTFEDDALLFAALRAGAISYLLKDCSPPDLIAAIRAAAERQSHLSPRVVSKVVAVLSRMNEPTSERLTTPAGLTKRECEVLALLGTGASNKEVSSALFIAEGTVKNHLTNIFRKLGVDDRTQAALKARELGISTAR